MASSRQTLLERTKSKARIFKAQRFSRPPRATFKQDAEYTIRKSLAEEVRDELLEQQKDFFFQRVFMFGKNVEFGKKDEKSPLDKTHLEISEYEKFVKEARSDDRFRKPKYPFFESLRELLDEIVTHVENETFTEDKLGGLFLDMGELTLLIVEGAEDMVDELLNLLNISFELYWTATRIFLVEDKIKNVYFNSFVCRRAAAVNVNEKFPTSTPNDEYEMSIQHWKIREKLHAFCERISDQLKSEGIDNFNEDFENPLPTDIYNKLIPEVQRIELVFLSRRFYRNLNEFSHSYGSITIKEGEFETKIWPMMYNYTPSGIFKSSEFEVNLTFGDYGKEEAKKAEAQAGAAVEAADEAGEEGEQGAGAGAGAPPNA